LTAKPILAIALFEERSRLLKLSMVKQKNDFLQTFTVANYFLVMSSHVGFYRKIILGISFMAEHVGYLLSHLVRLKPCQHPKDYCNLLFLKHLYQQ
jgi:hypothetical protein